MRIRTWHRHPRADVALTTWHSVTVTVSDGVRSYRSQTNGTLNPFTNVLTGFPAKNGVCAIRFRETGSVNVRNTVLVDGSETGEWAFDATSAGTPQFWSPFFILDNGATLTPLALGIFTPDDWRIMQMLGLNLFDALTAPYAAVPDGGGVFLLALVILSVGWSHENREPILRSELREKPHHVGSFRSWHGGASLAGRPALEIRIVVSRHGGPGESAGRRGMRRLEPPASVFVEETQYGVTCRLDRRRFGRDGHQRSQQSSVRFPLHGKCGRDGGGTVLLHARGMVVHPDGGRDHLRRRHRTVLDAGLVVA